MIVYVTCSDDGAAKHDGITREAPKQQRYVYNNHLKLLKLSVTCVVEAEMKGVVPWWRRVGASNFCMETCSEQNDSQGTDIVSSVRRRCHILSFHGSMPPTSNKKESHLNLTLHWSCCGLERAFGTWAKG